MHVIWYICSWGDISRGLRSGLPNIRKAKIGTAIKSFRETRLLSNKKRKHMHHLSEVENTRDEGSVPEDWRSGTSVNRSLSKKTIYPQFSGEQYCLSMGRLGFDPWWRDPVFIIIPLKPKIFKYFVDGNSYIYIVFKGISDYYEKYFLFNIFN